MTQSEIFNTISKYSIKNKLIELPIIHIDQKIKLRELKL